MTRDLDRRSWKYEWPESVGFFLGYVWGFLEKNIFNESVGKKWNHALYYRKQKEQNIFSFGYDTGFSCGVTLGWMRKESLKNQHPLPAKVVSWLLWISFSLAVFFYSLSVLTEFLSKI